MHTALLAAIYLTGIVACAGLVVCVLYLVLFHAVLPVWHYWHLPDEEVTSDDEAGE